MTDSPKDDPRGRWRPGGGINVPVRVEIKPLSKTHTRYQRYIHSNYVGARVILAIFASTLVRWSSQLLGHFIVSKNSAYG